jgi:hypothetical protein
MTRSTSGPSVALMSIEAQGMPCYLVEWYQPQVTAWILEDTAATLDECAAAMRVRDHPCSC